MEFDDLKLSNQLCFPVYAASRLIIREYQPHLNKLGITYPQYLVLLVLWETDKITVNELSGKLILNTNTLTPLLKRMELLNLITRNRSDKDERKVIISLTNKGARMKNEALVIPKELLKVLHNSTFPVDKLLDLRNNLNLLIGFLNENSEKK